MQLPIFCTLLLVTSVAAAGSQQEGNVVGNSPVVQASPEAHPQPSGVEQQPPHSPSYYAPAGMITVVGEQGPNKPGSQVRNFEQYGQPESASIPPNYKPFGSWGLYIGGNPADGYYTNYYKALSNSVDKQQAGEPSKPGQQTTAVSPTMKQAVSSPYGGGDYYPFAYSPSDLNSVAKFAVEPPVHYSPAQAGQQMYSAGSGAFEQGGQGGPSSYAAEPYATKRAGASFSQKEASKGESAAKGYQSRFYVYPSSGYQPASYPPSSGYSGYPGYANYPAPADHYPGYAGQPQPGSAGYPASQNYPSPAAYPAASAAAGSPPSQQPAQPGQGHQQVVAYPVPVGSQMVGSQPGVDGAFSPYGVHAFTRYAVKPTVVNHPEPSYYYSVQQPQGPQYPSYKQQGQQPQPAQPNYAAPAAAPAPGGSYYPSFYGFPLSQIQGPQYGAQGPQAGPGQAAHGGEGAQHSPTAHAAQPQVEAASEKSERNEDKPAGVQQKKA